MAAQTSRMLLSRNSKSLPLHLLRSGLSTTVKLQQPTLLHLKDCNLVQFLLGYQPTLGLAVNEEGVILDRRFGEMGRVEAHGKKRFVDDEDDDTDDSEDDDTEAFEGSDSDFDDDDEDEFDDDEDDEFDNDFEDSKKMKGSRKKGL